MRFVGGLGGFLEIVSEYFSSFAHVSSLFYFWKTENKLSYLTALMPSLKVTGSPAYIRYDLVTAGDRLRIFFSALSKSGL